ncbi:hypothetical protein BWQ96_04175 [Gracilariopsis chorda]|uniref:Uncharacterized protein n=1 Tax=Gracilariopsis chorda TaxID=448386 RepID=A0A2V3IVG3_9FLOR|nr:hypothetical protein BWQ96_04175 [Gracilariopsis chorda]|eukprot:PXF46075.1 hypothetical protein BWQ96_04175 [Gracilariopsis chorda]
MEIENNTSSDCSRKISPTSGQRRARKRIAFIQLEKEIAEVMADSELESQFKKHDASLAMADLAPGTPLPAVQEAPATAQLTSEAQPAPAAHPSQPGPSFSQSAGDAAETVKGNLTATNARFADGFSECNVAASEH